MTSTLPLSVLDLASVPDEATSSQALADTTTLAVAADRLGFHRFWVAEHHNLSSVASTSPSVLMAHLAAATEHIRLGSGGVMLPNHAPLAVAEQFALLEALHPGRIDLGIGRAPGTDPATARAIRRGHVEVEEEFPRDFLDLLGLLGDVRTESGLWEHFSATPRATSYPSVFLLGSSGFSAQLAGVLGLPFVFANHFDMGGTEGAIGLYRQRFEPSPALDRPHAIVTASVIAAPDRAEAEHLSAPSRLLRFGLRTGNRLPLLPPDEATAHPHFGMASSQPTGALYGSTDDVRDGLRRLVAATDADEVMLHLPAYAVEDRVRTLDLLGSTLPVPVAA